MKCPNCSRNHKKKDGMTCQCGYRFLFNPATNEGWTDGRFEALIRRASANDTRYFTLNQLYAAYCHKAKSKPYGIFVFFMLMTIIAGVVLELDLIALIIILALGGLAIWRHIRFAAPPSRKRFDALVKAWQNGKGPIARLLTKPALHDPPPTWPEQDIYDYGVERVLIVERDILVDLLVKNEIHARERVLVISAHGYPSYIEPHLQQVLSERADLPVFLLHDATATGVRLRHHPQVRRWTAGRSKGVIDLGIFPQDTDKIKALKPLKPRRSKGQLPVDGLMVTGMAGLLTASFAAAAPFAETMQQSAEIGWDFG